LEKSLVIETIKRMRYRRNERRGDPGSPVSTNFTKTSPSESSKLFMKARIFVKRENSGKSALFKKVCNVCVRFVFKMLRYDNDMISYNYVII
jgi:hypothetical protein